MPFDMIRLGLPNTTAIAALAFLPVVALTTLADPRPSAAPTEQVEAATICQTVVPCTEVALAGDPEFATE
jgi:hypothetical protein